MDLRHERVKPFHANIAYLHPLKTSSNQEAELTFTWSKSKIRALEKGVKYVQS